MSDSKYRNPMPEIVVNDNVPEDTIILASAKDERELFIPSKTVILKTKQKWYHKLVNLLRRR